MQKKVKISMLVIFGLLLTSIGIYTYCHHQNQLKAVFHKIEDEQIQYKEIGVILNGISYNNPLTNEELSVINKEIIDNLSHDLECHTHCSKEHDVPRSTVVENEIDVKQMWSYLNEDKWNVEVNIKNQEDKNFNTYLTIKSSGTDISMLDMLRNRALSSYKDLKMTPKETIYFKGEIRDKLTEDTMETLAHQLLEQLEAKKTNVYIDDLMPTTRVYYGYTKAFKGEVIEQSGEKSNVQVGFKYNEELNKTEVIIAFPFYNEPF